MTVPRVGPFAACASQSRRSTTLYTQRAPSQRHLALARSIDRYRTCIYVVVGACTVERVAGLGSVHVLDSCVSIHGWIDQSRATGRDMRLGQMCFACDASLRPATSRRVWPETDDSDLAKLGSVRHRPAVARACAPADRRRPSICRFRGAVAVPIYALPKGKATYGGQSQRSV